MNTALDQLRYLNKSEPLEHKLTFNELQNRPIGFQTAIPVDSTLEKMNSLQFKSMEGAMFEAASMASGQIRSEKQTEVMIDQAAALNEIPRTAAAAMAQPEGMTLPTEFQFGTAAPLHAADRQRAMQQVMEQQAAAQQAGLGAQMAADIHQPDRPNWSLRQMFGMAGPGLRGFLQGQSVPRPVPGFAGDVMPGIMRPPVPGQTPGMIMPQSTQQAYDQHYAALMAQQMAGPSAIPPTTAQPGSAPIAGALLGDSSGVARPGAPGI